MGFDPRQRRADTAYGWEREEWRCALWAAEDAGEILDDRPTRSDLCSYDEEFDEVDDES